MQKKTPLTKEEHFTFAYEIYSAREGLMRVAHRVSTSTRIDSKAVRALRKAVAALGEARSELDNTWYREIDPEGNAPSTPYYGRGVETFLVKP